MSVQSEIDRINGNVASTYTALSEMGATMPEQQNTANLANTVRTVPTGGGKTVQTDWNQLDETAPDFLKNKPFGDFPAVILEEQELVFDPEGGLLAWVDTPIQNGDAVEVVYDGVKYTCLAIFVAPIAATVFGNLTIADMAEHDTGEPFCGAYMDGMLVFMTQDEANHTIKVTSIKAVQIPEKYFTYVKFYTSAVGGGYLYKDSMCTIKATKEDIPNHADINIGISPVGYVAEWYRVHSVMSEVQNLAVGYGSVVVQIGATFATYYTAEYTPPETTE